MNVRQQFQRVFRRLGLISVVDAARYHLQKLRLSKENARFAARHPDFAMPPLSLLYEIGGRIRLEDYLEGGKKSSLFLSTQAKKWLSDQPVRILDWGCGVACVARNMSDHFPEGSTIYGSDYNLKMITWASGALPQIDFSKNELLPPLRFSDETFDWIYGLSVVTHLGEQALEAWLQEFHRVLKAGGILTLTTNGTGREDLFSGEELRAYRTHGIIVRGGLNEGRKMYLAYHHPDYFRRVVSKDWEILECIPNGMLLTGQDLWWLRRR